MSIFSHIRKSRQHAKEHTAKLEEQKKKEAEHIPYKHVPTHAAADAFASAPPSWREADRHRIVEQNRRRSAMAASGHHMNMPGVPRVGSSLSRVSYPGEDVAPMVRIPRAYSYTGVFPYPGSARDSREVAYTSSDMVYLHPGSLKGKEVPRAYDSQRISPASSKGDPSPVESSNGSTSSQDDLEMKPSKALMSRTSDGTAVHRLHPGRARRTSDTSANQYTLSSTSRGNSSYTRDTRPPPSMRGFGSIPAVAGMPPANMRVLPGTLAAQSHGINVSGGNAMSSSNSLAPSSRRGSSTSLPGLPDMPAKQAASAPVTPAATFAHTSEYPLNSVATPALESDMLAASVATSVGQAIRPDVIATPDGTSHATSSDNYVVQADHHYRDTDRMQQQIWETQNRAHNHRRMDRSRVPPAPAPEDLVNVFPEQAGPEVVPTKSGKTKRLSKAGGGKLLKKSRWSMSKPPAVAT